MINLHSNMVRFIINIFQLHFYLYHIIYIPIWLDLLLLTPLAPNSTCEDLHSNMVRFIMLVPITNTISELIFTFQYG